MQVKMVKKLKFNHSKKKSEKAKDVKNNRKTLFLKRAIIGRFSCKRRGVSEVITTVLLLGITVVGAAFLSTFFQDTKVTDVAASLTSKATSAQSVSTLKLIGYDTRKGVDLLDITLLSNDQPGTQTVPDKLCTDSCGDDARKNLLPADSGGSGGTEFIVLHIRNNDVSLIYILTIQINDVVHQLDTGTLGKDLDLTVSGSAGTNWPNAGYYSILPPTGTDNIKQKLSSSVDGGKEVRILVKLHPTNFNDDIPLNGILRVHVNTDRYDPSPFIISAGSTR